MNEIIIYELILLTEVLMMLQCMQMIFQQDVQFDKYMLGVILIHSVVYMAINLQLLPKICTVLVYIALFAYCRRVFKQSIKITIVRLIVLLALIGCIQGIIALLVFWFAGVITSVLMTFVSSLIGLLVVCAIKKITHLLRKRHLTIGNSGIFTIAIIGGLVLGATLINYNLNSGVLNINVILVLVLMLLMFFCLYWLEQANGEIQRKNYELEVQRVYGGAYEALLREVRRRQHDYKNQLGAVYSMHLVANSLEELVDMQNEYVDSLQSDSKYDSILTRCDNAILAGYLYYRCISCEREGVEVDYDIQIGQASCNFAVHEIIEILGILIDNACENFAVEQRTDKHIKLEFREEEETIMFSVANPAKHRTFSEIGNMFVRGYSSKGENRGIGLARVQELVKQYEAELKVENVSYDEINWLKFTIEIVKENK